MNQLTKKLFSGFVSLTTMAWSVGLGTFAVPNVASAATLTAGTLIKASGPAVYYYASDSKRYVFPNSTTYYSWYQDFSSVQTISDADLAAVPIGGNVTVRPGTRLVKITTDPKVYAVTRCGVLNWVQSETIATALWGANWARNVVDVPDAFFVNYNNSGSLAISSPVHPDGSLVTYSGSSDRFVIVGGQKRKFATSPDAFVANNYNPANVITTTISYPAGADVTARESNLADTVCLGSTTVTPPVQAGTLSVALASDTPAGVTVPRNAASTPLAKFNLTAGGSDVTVTAVTLNRSGVGATTDLANVYLFDTNGNRLTSGLSVNQTTNQVQFNNISFTVPANQTKAIVVSADFNASSAGGQHSFQIPSAASITAVPAAAAGSVTTSTPAVTVSGSFPMTGNMFTVGNTLAARLDVQNGNTPTNPNVGSQNIEVSNFKLVANTNDIEVRRLTLIQAGSAVSSDLSNFTLWQGSAQVAAAPGIVNNHITLTFNPPYVLSAGQSKNFSLHASVAGRTGRTIQTYVEYSTDVYAIDRLYGSSAGVCIAQTATGACTAAAQGMFDGSSSPSQGFSQVTTQGGTVTVAFNGPVAQNIARAATSVPLFNFALTNQNNAILVRSLNFTLVANGGSKLVGSAGTAYFRNLKVVNLANNTTLMGPTSLPSGVTYTSANSGVITFNQQFTLPANSTMNLSIQADLANTEDVTGQFFGSGTSTYAVQLGDGSGNIFSANTLQVVSTGEYLGTSVVTPNSTITGNTMTVKSSSLTVSLASSPATSNLVSKQLTAAAGFVLAAGGQSDILVTAIAFTGQGNTAGSFAPTALRTVAPSCGLYDSAAATGNLIGTSQTPDATATTKNLNLTNLNLTVPRGTSKTVYLKCTNESSVTQATGDQYSIGINAVADVTAQDSNSNSVTAAFGDSLVTANAASTGQAVIMTVMKGGNLSITAGNMRASDLVVAGGSVWQPLAEFRASSQYEDVSINRVAVTSTVNAANFTQVAIATNGAVVGYDVLPSGFNRNKDIDLSSNPLLVPNGSTVTFQLWGQIANTVASSTGAQTAAAAAATARSGNSISLGLASNLTSGEWNNNYNDKFNVRAYGLASGNQIYATSTNMTGGQTGNAFVVKRSRPYVTRQALTTTTLTSGLDTDLFKFQVAADPAGSISLKKFEFNLTVSTSTLSSSEVLSQFRLRRGTTDVTSNITIYDQVGRDLYNGGWTMASSSGKVIVYFTGNNEDVITGSGNVYTIHATVSGTVNTGDSVSMSFRRSANATPSQGYLTQEGTATSTSSLPGPHIDTGVSATNTFGSEGTFVWSDLSENPHSPNSAFGAVSSRDWNDDVYVQDLTPTQVLSR